MRVAVHRKEYVRAQVNLYLPLIPPFSHAKHAYHRLRWSKRRVIQNALLRKKKQTEKEIEAEKDEVAEKNMKRVAETSC